MSTLASRIAEVVEARGLKRGWMARLAKKCGIAGASVSDWVSGKSKTMDGENLLVASEFFGVHARWLSTGSGPRDAATTGTDQIAGDSPNHSVVRIDSSASLGVDAISARFGELLAAVKASKRAEVGGLLNSWALSGGEPSYLPAVIGSLSAGSAHRKQAGA